MPEKETEETEEIEEEKEENKAAEQKPKPEQKPAKRKKIVKAKKVEIEETEDDSPVFLQKKPEPETKKEVPEKEKEEWFEPEGQLAIDVYQTQTELVIQTAIAGVKPEDLDISMERDIVTIKGCRQKPTEENGDYFTQECYWGPFSREVILPVEIDPDRAIASMKEGILIIKIPKILREKKRTIKVRI